VGIHDSTAKTPTRGYATEFSNRLLVEQSHVVEENGALKNK
jgi:hypothetical protein